MSAFESDVVRRKIMRGAILKILSNGQPVLVQTIEVMLNGIGENVEKDLTACLNFLLDRKYVRIWDDREGNTPESPYVMICITAASGQDVSDGTVRDLGIIIPKKGRR